MASCGNSGFRIFEAKMNPLEQYNTIIQIAIIQSACSQGHFVGFEDVNLGLFEFPGSQEGVEPREANWGG